MGYQDDDGHYNRGSNRDYGGHRDYDRRGGGGGGYRNDRRRRSGGGGGGYRNDHRNDRGGGYRNTKRRRTDYGGGGGGGPKLNAAPAVDMGAASSKLVQLLVRVADARALKTTDAEIPSRTTWTPSPGPSPTRSSTTAAASRASSCSSRARRPSAPAPSARSRPSRAARGLGDDGAGLRLRDCAACRFDAVDVAAFDAPSPLPEVACAFTVPAWASCASGVLPTLPVAEDAMDDDGGLSALEKAVLAEAAVTSSRRRRRRGRFTRRRRGGAPPTLASPTDAPAKRGRADPGLDALHAVLELCALSPTGFAPKFANAVELFFRELDDVAAPAARRVAEFFAHFLSNTKFAWPYWSYWAAVADEDGRGRWGKKKPRRNSRATPTRRRSRVVDPPEDAAGEAREPRPADAALAAAFDALGDDAAKAAAVMRGVFARGAASFTHALAPLDDAELSAALRNLVRDDDDCEAAALDALADVWAASAQHVALLADALVRRGVVRCRAVAAWVLDPRNESPWAGSTIGASFKPHELLQVAVDRSLDLLSAAVASAAARGADAATDGVVLAQLDEAHEVALEICSRLARGLCDRDGDDSADAVSYRDAALGRSPTSGPPTKTRRGRAPAARSAPAAELPDVLQASDLRGKLDVPVPAVAAAVDRALGLN
ncbi:hypothetical protein JL722_6257 [Aureococcus anophagefferens]|nr:hypothetical protein JL722_6257 [Aureococcus anophagefferens]